MVITLQGADNNFINELKEWLDSKGQNAIIKNKTAKASLNTKATNELKEAINELKNGGGERFSSFSEYQKAIRA